MTRGDRDGPKDTGPCSVGITPARARVLDRLRSRREPWSIPELAQALGLHPNTVREHLSALVDEGLAGFIEVRSEGPGRPARHYQEAELGCGIDYLELVSALAESIRGLPDGVGFAERTGAAWGARLTERLAISRPNHDLFDGLKELGFAPVRQTDSTIELRSCPVLAAARRNPEIVCGVHRGLVRSMARPSCGEVAVDLRPLASDTGCLLRLLSPVAGSASLSVDSVGAQVLG